MISDCDSANAALKRISIHNPPFPVVLSVTCDDASICLKAVLDVFDRDQGFQTYITFSFVVPWRSITFEEFSEWVGNCVMSAFVHEFNECFHVDGVRVRDPHPNADNPNAIVMYSDRLLAADHE